MQTEKECYLCKTTRNLQKHHALHGSYRKNADKYGLWVWLCADHHTMGRDAIHRNPELDKELMKEAQRKFEETHTREEFIALFGKNRLS